jgi:uncharacterized damage-inducible protein DinB
MKREKAQINILLQILDEAFRRQAWHGTNLGGSIRGITPEQAAWKPRKDRHNIREIVLHAAYWKYAVRRRLTGEKRGSFPLEGSNWFPRPEVPNLSVWRNEIRLLEEMHQELVREIERMQPTSLFSTPSGSKVANIRQVYGIAMHDVYHAGQIQLIKRLMKKIGPR